MQEALWMCCKLHRNNWSPLQLNLLIILACYRHPGSKDLFTPHV